MEEGMYFIQFMHPGKEPRISKNDEKAGILKWNRGVHTRKFLKIKGEYLTLLNSSVKESILNFWGEWEPDSKIKKICSKATCGPQYIHEPIFVKPKSNHGLLNTDPFVFCRRFFYTVCQQYRGEDPKQLRYLKVGSVVLFGSHLQGSFVLDTVFVVKSYFDYNEENYQQIAKKVPPLYKSVTLDLLFNNPCVKKCLQNRNSLRLYFGATYHDPVDGMFSFFPCRPYPELFDRPVIKGRFLEANLKQGFKKCIKVGEVKEIKKHWNNVVNQVLDQGLYLGLYAGTPGI